MHVHLLKSWLRLVTVWWIGATMWWAMSDNRIALTFKTLTGKTLHVDPLNSGMTALRTLAQWSVPVVGITLAGAGLGFGVSWVIFALRGRTRRHRVRTTEDSKWRGLSLSMGEIEKPRWANLDTADLDMTPKGQLAARLAKMTPVQAALFREVLERVGAYPDAFVGDGHVGSLLKHTWHVLSRLPDDCDDPLLPILAAAHDVGKILAWRRTAKGDWKRVGWHDDLGGLILSCCPSADKLPPREYTILVCALRFDHKPDRTPVLPEFADTKRMKRLQAAIAVADHSATAVEKQHVLAKLDKGTILRQAFLKALPTLRFQSPGTKTGVSACGWRKGPRVYFSEWGLREELKPHIAAIDADAAAAWDTNRTPGALAPQTIDLLRMFDEAGWLVKKLNGIEARPPLWIVRSGSKDLNGLIILELPAEMQARLPKDAPYRMEVVSPLNGPAFPKDARPTEPKSKDAPAAEHPVKPQASKTKVEAPAAPVEVDVAEQRTGADTAPQEPAREAVTPAKVDAAEQRPGADAPSDGPTREAVTPVPETPAVPVPPVPAATVPAPPRPETPPKPKPLPPNPALAARLRNRERATGKPPVPRHDHPNHSSTGAPTRDATQARPKTPPPGDLRAAMRARMNAHHADLPNDA